MHQAEREQRVGAGADGEVLVGQRGRARAERVDDDQLCTRLPRSGTPRLLDEGPQVNAVAMHVRAPHHNQAGVREVLRRRTQARAVDLVEGGCPRACTDRPVQLRRAQPVKEAAVHGGIAKLADGARIAVRQDAFRPELCRDCLQLHGNRVQRLIPRDAFKGFGLASLRQRAFRHTGFAAHGIEKPLGRVHAIQIPRHLAAQEAARDRMRRVALHLHCPACQFIDGHQHTAGIRTVMRADRVYRAGGHRQIVGWCCIEQPWRADAPIPDSSTGHSHVCVARTGQVP